MKLVVIVIFMYVVVPWFISASAHTLKIDDSIGVTIHIEPDDAPIANQKSNIFVEIKDKNNQFNPEKPSNCDCFITIRFPNNKFVSMPLVTGNRLNPIPFIFPQSGTYAFQVKGSWNGKDKPFQSFETNYTYYVRGDKDHFVEETDGVQTNILKQYLSFVILIATSTIVILFLLSVNIVKK